MYITVIQWEETEIFITMTSPGRIGAQNKSVQRWLPPVYWAEVTSSGAFPKYKTSFLWGTESAFQGRDGKSSEVEGSQNSLLLSFARVQLSSFPHSDLPHPPASRCQERISVALLHWPGVERRNWAPEVKEMCWQISSLSTSYRFRIEVVRD